MAPFSKKHHFYTKGQVSQHLSDERKLWREKGVSTKFELIVLLSAPVISVLHRKVENQSSVRPSIKYPKMS